MKCQAEGIKTGGSLPNRLMRFIVVVCHSCVAPRSGFIKYDRNESEINHFIILLCLIHEYLVLNDVKEKQETFYKASNLHTSTLKLFFYKIARHVIRSYDLLTSCDEIL